MERSCVAVLLSTFTLIACSNETELNTKIAQPKKVSTVEMCELNYICKKETLEMQYGICCVTIEMTPGEQVDKDIAKVEHFLRFVAVHDVYPDRAMVVTLRDGRTMRFVFVYTGEDAEVGFVEVDDQALMRSDPAMKDVFALADRVAANILRTYLVDVEVTAKSCNWNSTTLHDHALEFLQSIPR